MAPTTTVTQVRTAERDRATAALGTAQGALSAATAALEAARADGDQATRDLIDLEAALSVIHQQIADPTTSDAQLHQLEQERVATRVAHAKQASVLAVAQDRVAVAEREVRSASARVDRSKARLAECEATLAQARRADTEANAWRVALTGPGMAGVVADAGSAATGALVTLAETAMAPWVGGAELYALLELRLRDAQDEADEPARAAARALAAVDDLRTSFAATDGAVVVTAAAFERERDLTRRVAEQTGARLAAARATLAGAATEAGPTAAEVALITTTAGAVTGTPVAQQGAARERELHEARLDERAALAELEVRSLPRLAADPGFDVAGDAATTAAHTAHADAVDVVSDAETALTTAMRTKLDTWEASIPPRGMDVLTRVLRATATVNEIKALGTGGPNGLERRVAALDDAEDDYATALAAQNQARLLLEAAGDLAAARADAADAVRPVSDQRVAAGVRGDA